MKQIVFCPHGQIRVTKLDMVPPFYPLADGMRAMDPLGALRELDAEVADLYGRNHCRVIGLDFGLSGARSGPSILTSPDEFIVDVNPPWLPA